MAYLLSEARRQVVVIVEDDSGNAQLLEMLLAIETGFQALLYQNAIKLLEHLDEIKGRSPVLFFIDRRLPHMDGLLLCKHLRAIKEFKQVPFILVTASPDEKCVQEMKQQGILLIPKPYDIPQLLNMVWQYT